MPDHLTDDDLDEVAQMLIPKLEAVAAIDYPDPRLYGCKYPGCDRVGYASGRCQPHHDANRAAELALGTVLIGGTE